MMDDYLEDEYKPAFQSWQQNQTPEGNAALLKALDPIVQKGVKMYGAESPLTSSRAKLLTLDAVRKYDPKRSRLQSHLLNQMQGLRRINQQQHQVISVPERILLENQRLHGSTQELSDELGRDPTDAELSDRLGIAMPRLAKIRSYQPGVNTGRLDAIDPLAGGAPSVVPNQQASADLWGEVVYQGLSPLDQRVMELTLGMRGNKKLSNQEIAAKLNRSPGAITQRKTKIQQLLDQEQKLSPFIPR